MSPAKLFPLSGGVEYKRIPTRVKKNTLVDMRAIVRLEAAKRPARAETRRKAEAAARFELPPERLGDIVVVSTKHKVLGTSAAKHDLSGLTEPLRSHGGISEQRVPLICNRKMAAPAGSHRWRNFDAFDLALNLVA